METRVNIQTAFPAAWKAMYSLSAVLQNSGISTTIKELIKIRSSQINRCAFCLDMHTKEALKNGETAHRIFMLQAWEEATAFTDEEKAVLALTENVTLISEHGVPDEVYANASKYFDETTIAEIIMAVVIINGWNRMAISAKLKA